MISVAIIRITLMNTNSMQADFYPMPSLTAIVVRLGNVKPCKAVT